MIDPTTLTAMDLAARLATGELTSAAVTDTYLRRIERTDKQIGAFLRWDRSAAMQQAEAVDKRRKAGEKIGRLAGIPVAVKDLVCMRGELTTCGSKMLADFRAPYDATIIEKLRAADVVFIGRTNMDEFAMGGSNANSAFFPCRNPWDTTRIPGGSSGGAAACVAADFAPLSIGSDTGGSIRQPAGLCGVTGLKPTYGRVSRYGLVAFASSLDQLGPLAHTAQDNALLLQVIAGHDPRDSTSVDTAVPDYVNEIKQPLTGLRLGVVAKHFGEGLSPEVAAAVRQVIDVYRSLGATIHDIELPHADYAVATYYVIAPCEASSNLARYDGIHYGFRADESEIARRYADNHDSEDNALVRVYRSSRAAGFGDEVKRRIMIGAYALSAGYYDAYYQKALQVRRLIRRDYDEAFGSVDLIIGPVTATTAFRTDEKQDDPLAMYLVDLYTVAANLAGIPGLAMPCGLSPSGLPIGVQLQAPPFQESRLLRAAQMYQQVTDWHTRRPQLV